MPKWQVHKAIARILDIDINITNIVDDIIDLRKPHDGITEFGAFADKLLEIIKRFGNDMKQLMQALMAFHLHHILDIAYEKGSLTGAIKEYKQIIQDFISKTKTLSQIKAQTPQINNIIHIDRYSSDEEGITFDDIEPLKDKIPLIKGSLEELLRRIQEKWEEISANLLGVE